MAKPGDRDPPDSVSTEWRKPAGWALVLSSVGALLYVALSVATERFYGRLGVSAQAVGVTRDVIITRSVVGAAFLLAVYGLGGAIAVWLGTRVAIVIRGVVKGPLLPAAITVVSTLVPMLILAGMLEGDVSRSVEVLLVLLIVLGTLLLLGWLSLFAESWPRLGPLDASRQLLFLAATVFTFVGLAVAADSAADRVRRGEVPSTTLMGFVIYPWSAIVALRAPTTDAQRICQLYLGESARAVFVYDPRPGEGGRTVRLPGNAELELLPTAASCPPP